ncbi:MAG: hypothetical protein IKI70_07160 [Bacteroidales bacterium]|nr:hypothetical protein [Bacteroidales bacterium]MBR3286025.1 hypothetical protein [Bacteroidales bacterium]
MKLLKVVAATMTAVMLTTSCGVLGLGSTKKSKGVGLGAALLALYAGYKLAGKVDLGNLGNIVNLASIINILRGNALEGDNTELVAGLIEGAQNTISPSNAEAIVGLLGQLSNLDLNKVTTTAKSLTNSATQEATQAAAATLAASPEVQSALNTLNSIFRLMN